MAYEFFKKHGRPTKVENKICASIEHMIKNDKSGRIFAKVEEFGACETIDQLKELQSSLWEYVENDSSAPKVDFQKIKKEADASISSPSLDDNDAGGINPEDIDYSKYVDRERVQNVTIDPFAQPVVDREYTKEKINPETDPNVTESTEGGEGAQSGIADAVIEQEQTADGQTVHTPPPVEEDIPTSKWDVGINYDQEEEQTSEEEGEGESEKGEKEKLGGDNLEELSPAQKRKAAEKTADALLNTYERFIPIPFKMWAKISEKKYQKLCNENKIDPNMQLEDQITVDDYVRSFNERVEEIFVVDEETIQEIREPLIEVLMENEIALTPMQRLLVAVGGHLITMTFQAIKLSRENKDALEQFAKFHAERIGHAQPRNTENPSTTTTSSSPPQSPPPAPQQEVEIPLSKSDAELAHSMVDMMNELGDKEKKEDEDEVIELEAEEVVED